MNDESDCEDCELTNDGWEALEPLPVLSKEDEEFANSLRSTGKTLSLWAEMERKLLTTIDGQPAYEMSLSHDDIMELGQIFNKEHKLKLFEKGIESAGLTFDSLKEAVATVTEVAKDFPEVSFDKIKPVICIACNIAYVTNYKFHCNPCVESHPILFCDCCNAFRDIEPFEESDCVKCTNTVMLCEDCIESMSDSVICEDCLNESE